MKYRVWQVGWEDEFRVVDLEDPSCVACESVGRPVRADVDAIVMAFVPDDPNDSTGKVEYRRMEPALFGLGWLCREATPTEIEQQANDAVEIRTGKVEEVKPTESERKASDEAAKSIRTMAQPLIGGLLSAFGGPRAQAVGNAMVSEWAAREGMKMGEQYLLSPCQCSHTRKVHKHVKLGNTNVNVAGGAYAGSCEAAGCGCQKFRK